MSSATKLSAMLLSLYVLLAIPAVAIASPNMHEARDVYSPKVTYPGAGTVWVIGDHHNVTWDASNPPGKISNRASISLVKDGRLLETGPGSLESPMAKDFDLRSGREEVQVPNVAPGSDYQIVLFGDSGNWGPTFTIAH